MPSYASWRVLLVGLAAAIAVAAYVHAQRGPRPRLPEPALVKRSPLDRAVAGTPELSLQPPVGRSPLAERMDRVAAGVAGDFTDVRALLVVQNGALRFERYLRGAAADTPFNVKSVTKSVVSSLVGIALRDGSVRSIDDPIAAWLPEVREPGVDPRVARLTLRHLLEMSAGFEWEENGPATGAWLRSPDYVRHILRSPLSAAPGERFNYNTAVAHLVSVVLTRATGRTTRQLAEQELFGPLGIEAGPWSRDPAGFFEGGSELHLKARDMARFGLLFLNKGRWNDRVVIPESWVLESTRPHKRVDYGLMWSYLPEEWGGPAVCALGYGGQMIALVPDANAVIVVASTTTNAANDVMRLFRERLLPAVRGG